MKEIKNYRIIGGTGADSGKTFDESIVERNQCLTLEEQIWEAVRDRATDDYEQRITVNGDEYAYSTCFGDGVTKDSFKQDYGIEHITSISYRVHPWNPYSDEEVYEIVEVQEPEVWHVGWAEFDGWESELYAGSEVFKTKEEAIAWVENDYNTTLAEKFDQDPDEDPDDHPELKLDPNNIDDNSTVEFPEYENFYRKWIFNRTKI